MAQFTLYGPPISTYVRTVRMLFEETGTAYTLEPVDILKGQQNSPEYLAKHPFGKVPALMVDDEILYETCAIVEYLDQTLNNKAFTPNDPMQQAHMRQIMAVIDSYLYSPAISTITIQRLIVPSQGGQSDEAAIQAAVPQAKTALEAIEAIATRSHLLGGEVTLADFYLLPVVLYLSQTPECAAVMQQTPMLKTWWETASQRPSFVKVTS